MTPAALYLRVSREDLSLDNQRPELARICAARDFDVVATYEEAVSAAKTRPEYNRMMRAAQRGEFRVLVVWSLDRFGRSMVGNMQDALELDRVGVQLISARDAWLDTTSGPVRSLLLGVFSWCAEQERDRLVERTKAGIERARRSGKHVGRPVRVTPAVVRAAGALQGEGRSVREIAMAMKLPRSSVQKALRLFREEIPCPPRPPAPEYDAAHTCSPED